MGVGIERVARRRFDAGRHEPEHDAESDADPPKYKDRPSGLTWDVKAGRNNKDFHLTDSTEPLSANNAHGGLRLETPTFTLSRFHAFIFQVYFIFCLTAVSRHRTFVD